MINTPQRILPSIDQKGIQLPSGFEFPQICFKSGRSQDLKKIPLKLTWTPPWAFLLLIFPGILVGLIIISLALTKKADFTVWLSQEEYRRAQGWKRITIGLFLIPIVILIAGLVHGAGSQFIGMMALAILICWIASIIVHETKVRFPLKAQEIDGRGVARFKKLPPPVLEAIESGIVRASIPPTLPPGIV